MMCEVLMNKLLFVLRSEWLIDCLGSWNSFFDEVL